MAMFLWTGKTRSGDIRTGEMEAANAETVEQRLRAQQITPTKVRKKPAEIYIKMPGTSGVTARDLMVFTRQFSVMIDAGLPLVQCLDILSTQQENIWFKRVLVQVKAPSLMPLPKIF